jgi:hypothetical protein
MSSAADAFSCHVEVKRIVKAEQSLWPFLAEAFHHIEKEKLYKALGYESLNEYLADPEVAVGQTKARRLAKLWGTFSAHLGDESYEALARVKWSKLFVTERAVKLKQITCAEALADVEVLTKTDLEVKYSGESSKLDADAEPAKCKCMACGNVHRPKASQ